MKDDPIKDVHSFHGRLRKSSNVNSGWDSGPMIARVKSVRSITKQGSY